MQLNRYYGTYMSTQSSALCFQIANNSDGRTYKLDFTTIKKKVGFFMYEKCTSAGKALWVTMTIFRGTLNERNTVFICTYFRCVFTLQNALTYSGVNWSRKLKHTDSDADVKHRSLCMSTRFPRYAPPVILSFTQTIQNSSSPCHTEETENDHIRIFSITCHV